MAIDTMVQSLQDEVAALRRRIAELEQADGRPNGVLQQHQLSAIEAALDGIAIMDSQGTYVYMNRSHALVHGYDDPAELIGKSWTVVVPDDQIPVFQQQHMPLLYSAGSWRGEVLSKRRDGSLHPTDTSLRVLDDGGLICIVRDVTESKRTERDLQRSQLMLQMVIDSIPQSIYWKDIRHTYMGGNRSFALQAGLHDTSEIAGKTDHDMSWAAVADRYIEEDRQVITSGEPRMNTEELVKGAGGDRWIQMSKIPLRGSEGRIFAVLGLYEDVTDRKRGEFERSRLQEEIIEAQAAALAELSTPLIPISDRVMVMPLIGSVDSRRAQQVIDTLLSGIAANHAASVILDITGVPVVDTQVANALLRAAQAVRLLGAQVVLTGIRPEVAQTLVSLGTDLSGITTRSSLQSGIAYVTSS